MLQQENCNLIKDLQFLLSKGEEKGWLKIDPSFVEEIDDEISATKIKNNWSRYYKGNLINLFGQLPKPITLLSEYGDPQPLSRGL